MLSLSVVTYEYELSFDVLILLMELSLNQIIFNPSHLQQYIKLLSFSVRPSLTELTSKLFVTFFSSRSIILITFAYQPELTAIILSPI